MYYLMPKHVFNTLRKALNDIASYITGKIDINLQDSCFFTTDDKNELFDEIYDTCENEPEEDDYIVCNDNLDVIYSIEVETTKHVCIVNNECETIDTFDVIVY